MPDSGEECALLGGPVTVPAGPPAWPIRRDAVADVLRAAAADGSWGRYHGPHVERLVMALMAHFAVPHALTCASGTLAVEACLRAVGVGAGDEVILAALDYGANFATVHALGATPVLVDVADNLCLNPDHLAAAASTKTKAILCSHLLGGLVPMTAVCAFAAERGLAVVEDACQAPGGKIDGKPAGAWGTVAALSFGGSKLLTAGRGGAVLATDARAFQRAKSFLKRGPQEWAALSEIQAAVLLPQIADLAADTTTRYENAVALADGLNAILGLTSPLAPASGERVRVRGEATDTRLSLPALYKFPLRIDEPVFGITRDLFVAAIRAEGVAFDAGFAALHVGRSPSRFRAATPLDHAEKAAREIAILHHPVFLGPPDGVTNIVRAAAKVYRNAARLRAAFPR